MSATTTTYTLGGVTFNNNTADGDGVMWFATLSGWNTTPMRQQVMERIGADGVIVVESHRSAKHLTLAGTAKATSLAGYWAARNKIENSLIFVTSTGTLVVNETAPKQISVYSEGEPLVARVQDTYMVEFSLGYLAPAPAKTVVP